MTISSNGSLTASAEDLGNKAMKALFHLKRSIGGSNILPSIGLRMYDQLILPISLYGCEIWGVIKYPNKANKLNIEDKYQKMKFEKIHLNFCKFLLQVNSKTTNAAVYGELGRYPLYINIIKHVMNT